MPMRRADFCLPQIGNIKPLGEPAIEGVEKIARFRAPALFVPQLRQHRCAAKFEEARTLLAGDLERLGQVTFGHCAGTALGQR